MRTKILQAIKYLVRKGMTVPITAKLFRLISEERTQYNAEAALHRSSDVLGAIGNTVRRGPFVGLSFPSRETQGSGYITKILGAYESELHDLMERLCRRGYDMFIDIGAAEGYYAVGFAMRSPDSRVVAFEGTERGRRLLRSMAEANGVASRVEIRGWCSAEDINNLLLPTDAETLILCDVEGFEYTLLDLRRAFSIKRCDILIELHHSREINARDWVLRNFHDTHEIDFIDQMPRSTADYPEIGRLDHRDRQLILLERTDDEGWVFLRKRA